MKIWIDVAHPPHPLLFEPVARRLAELGHEVRVTARNAAQTLELARERWHDVEAVGGPSPKSRRAKGAAIVERARALRRWAKDVRPDACLSHNSYAQIVAARSRGIPAVTAMDYEYQPANHLAFRLADRILLPEILDDHVVRRQGAKAGKTSRYPGLKEEAYVGEFEPDDGIFDKLGVVRTDDTVAVAVRAPSFHTLYHRFENPIFGPILASLAAREDVRCVVLTRHPEQRAAIVSQGAENVTVPDHAVDTRSLMYAADLVIGAGGTMTREAAVLGVPTISIFAGREPAVDRWLEQAGRLRRVTSVAELGLVKRRDREPRPLSEIRERGRVLVDAFATATIATAGT